MISPTFSGTRRSFGVAAPPGAPHAHRRDGDHREGEAAQREQFRVIAVPVEAEHDVVCARGDVDGDERRRHHPGRSPPTVHRCRPPGVVGGAEHRDSGPAHPHRRRGLAITEAGTFRADRAGGGLASHRRQPAIPATAGHVPDTEIRAVRGEPGAKQPNAAGTHVRPVRRDLTDDPAGLDVAGAAAGATWWLPEFDPATVSLDQVRGVLRDGPATP